VNDGEGWGGMLDRMLGPQEPSPGPPYTHVLKLPETEEEIAAEPLLPRLTITRDGDS
jgi:hypothetical protein